MFAADLGKDLNAVVGEGGIGDSLGGHLGYGLLRHPIRSVAGAGFTEEKGTAGIYSSRPWASWSLRGGNERLGFHQGRVFSGVWLCGYRWLQL